MTTLGGNLANYEEALRALYAGDQDRFAELVSDWPTDLADYLGQLAAPIWD